MTVTVFVFVLSVVFMTVFSLLRAVEGKIITRCTKENIRVWITTAVLSLCINICIGVVSCGFCTGDWNLLNAMSNKSFSDVSYQQIFDFSLMLLIMYAGSAVTGFLLKRFRCTDRMAGKSRNLLCLCLSSFLFLVVAVLLFAGIQGESHVLISEFYLPDKKTTLAQQEAYIEIANHGDFACETGDWYLSDDCEHLQKVPLPQERISSKGTVLIPLDDNVFAFGEKGGDLLLLSNRNGDIVDKITTGDTRKNKSYTRNYADRSWEYRDPSPGVYNLDKPQFSVAPGFYDDTFYVELSAQDGADIYYTWDGSTPTVASEKYTKKILIYDRSEESNQYRSIQNVIRNWKENIPDPTPVPKGTVIRAIAVNEEGFASEIATATYFVNRNDIRENYVVSLVADPEDLFGPQGIYSTGEAYDEWYLNGRVGKEPEPNYERKDLECFANFELFHATPEGYLNQHCSLAVQGGSTRDMYVLKRLSIFAREECSGSEFFDQNLFGNRRSHSLVLRDGLANAFTMELFPERSVAVQKSIPVTVFLNGEFWYDTYLQEKYSDEYFEELYQLEDAEFHKGGVTEEIWTFVEENDIGTEDGYLRLNELVDVQSYIDFMCANIYLANTDYTERVNGGNSAMWRSRSVEDSFYGDGRWRWALYDMDLLTSWGRRELGLEHITDAELNSFTTVRSWAGPVEERIFYSNLRKSPQFRKQFVLTFMDMVNTCFVPDFVEPILIKHGRDITYHDSFFLNRKEHITRYLADSYDLTGTREDLVLEISDPKAGWLQVNTCQPDLSKKFWTGTYYTDYPVTITAEEQKGYRFVRWEGDVCSQSPVISVTLPEGGASIRAIYEPYEN